MPEKSRVDGAASGGRLDDVDVGREVLHERAVLAYQLVADLVAGRLVDHTPAELVGAEVLPRAWKKRSRYVSPTVTEIWNVVSVSLRSTRST